jgi:hypothetical protein
MRDSLCLSHLVSGKADGNEKNFWGIAFSGPVDGTRAESLPQGDDKPCIPDTTHLEEKFPTDIPINCRERVLSLSVASH